MTASERVTEGAEAMDLGTRLEELGVTPLVVGSAGAGVRVAAAPVVLGP